MVVVVSVEGPHQRNSGLMEWNKGFKTQEISPSPQLLNPFTPRHFRYEHEKLPKDYPCIARLTSQNSQKKN